MMLYVTITVLSLLPLLSAAPQNFTEQSSNKAKRAVSDQTYNHGDAKAVLFYAENTNPGDLSELQTSASSPQLRNFYSTPAKPLALVSVQQPIQVFEQDGPKQVAEQQVLYEFQQTPTNAVSNVHVKQLFQPSNEVTTQNPLYQGLPASQTHPSSIHSAVPVITAHQHFARSQAPASNQPASSATIVLPVHHNQFPNHNAFHPETQQYQNTHAIPKEAPGKYIYLNGKIVYNPAHVVQQGKIPQNSVFHSGVYHNQQKLPLIQRPVPQQAPVHVNLGRNVGYPLAQGKQTPQVFFPTITNNRFIAPKQLYPVDKPSTPVRHEEAKQEKEGDAEQEDDDEEDTEDDDDDDEDDAASENHDKEKEKDDEDDDSFENFESFPFEDDDESEHNYFKPSKYRSSKYKDRRHDRDETSEEDDDEDREDTKRGASKHHYYHYPRQSRRHRNSPKYERGLFEGYSADMKYKSKKDKYQKPTGKYKKFKFSKINGRKPKLEMIEGRFSENMPITHKQKVYKERWYLTKDIEGGVSDKTKNIK